MGKHIIIAPLMGIGVCLVDLLRTYKVSPVLAGLIIGIFFWIGYLSHELFHNTPINHPGASD